MLKNLFNLDLRKKYTQLARAYHFKAKETAILYKIDEIRDKAKDLDEFLRLLLNEIIRTINVEMGFIMIFNERSNQLEIKAVNDKGLYLFKGTNYELMKSLAEESVKHKRPIIQKNIRQQPRFAKLNFDIKSVLTIPLILNNKVVGVFEVINKRDKNNFSGVDLKLFEAIVSQADSAIEHAKTREEMEHRLKQVNVLYALDELRDKAENLQQLLNGILEEIMKNVPSKEGYVLFYNDKKKRLEIRAKKICTTEKASAEVEIVSLANKVLRGKEWIKAKEAIVIPLILNDKPLGAFIVKNKTKGSYDHKDVEILEAIMSQADSAIEHANTFANLVQRKKELDALYSIDKIRDESDNFEDMLDKILKELVKTIEAHIGFIMLYNEKKEELEIKVMSDNAHQFKQIIHKMSNDALKAKELVLKNNLSGDAKSSMTIPLVLNEKIIGVFGAINSKTKEEFDSDDVRLLEAISSQADTAIFEDFEKQKIKGVFKRYVDESVVDEMLNSEEDFMKGKKKHMSVLFADIRGFTSMSEGLKPEELVITINEYLGAMTDQVMAHKATLDKFVGDEVMALFGTPVDMPDHAVCAIETAIDMQKAMKKLQKKWKKEGKKESAIGIGINTGDMVAGNIGCEKMTDYTVLGDNVNLGARLCGSAPGDSIIISEKTYKEVEKETKELKLKIKFKFKKLDPISVKGKAKLINIYEIIY